MRKHPTEWSDSWLVARERGARRRIQAAQVRIDAIREGRTSFGTLEAAVTDHAGGENDLAIALAERQRRDSLAPKRKAAVLDWHLERAVLNEAWRYVESLGGAEPSTCATRAVMAAAIRRAANRIRTSRRRAPSVEDSK